MLPVEVGQFGDCFDGCVFEALGFVWVHLVFGCQLEVALDVAEETFEGVCVNFGCFAHMLGNFGSVDCMYQRHAWNPFGPGLLGSRLMETVGCLSRNWIRATTAKRFGAERPASQA